MSVDGLEVTEVGMPRLLFPHGEPGPWFMPWDFAQARRVLWNSGALSTAPVWTTCGKRIPLWKISHRFSVPPVITVQELNGTLSIAQRTPTTSALLDALELAVRRGGCRVIC
jgi:hypothetical protein